jgi:acyl carrier protein
VTIDSTPDVCRDAHQDVGDRLHLAMRRLAVTPRSGSDSLAALHIDSLTLLRIISAVLDPDADIDIDPVSLGSVRTVDQLAEWLRSAEESAATATEPAS